MKRTTIAAVMLVTVLALALSVNTALNKTNAQSVPKTSQANAAERVRPSCSLKTVLPGALSSKLECEPCCDLSIKKYTECSLDTNGSECECLAYAYQWCLDGGCGPCMCCWTWVQLGRDKGCINDEKEWKQQRRGSDE